MKSRPHQRLSGFSLVEVVIAVGIFAVSIIAVIGLLAPTNRNISNVRDTDEATRVVSAIQGKLQEVAQKDSAGFTSISTYLQTAVPTDPADGSSIPPTTFTLYSSRDGSKIGLGSNATTFPNASDKYYEIVLIRNATLSPNSGSNLDSAAGYLAYTMRLRWPAFVPNDAGGEEFTQHTQKSVLLIPSAVHR